jgi:pimeloyl-ACP methyl ester carboxylesterase
VRRTIPAYVCVHGLTRNGRDFDFVAQALEQDYRIICPDMPGRGQSDWLEDAKLYNYDLYCADLVALLARLQVDHVDWLGTSMGGLIGMSLAARKNSPIRRLLINDIGPFIPKAALDRIGQYVGRDPRFPDYQAVTDYIRLTYSPFGNLAESHWQHLVAISHRRLADGSYALHYDPRIAEAFLDVTGSLDLWDRWDKITCPVTVFRGAKSDLLLAETAHEMQERGPKATLVEFADCGHAPMLMAEEQIAAVKRWLLNRV